MTPASITKAQLRLAACASFYPSEAATLQDGIRGAIYELGFLQADPIRAPARAQDLILFQRVKHYQAGALEAHYPQLDGIEEDYLLNYGFMPRELLALQHPRRFDYTLMVQTHAADLIKPVLQYVKSQAEPVHPSQVQRYFGDRKMRSGWGGQQQASTRVLDYLHRTGKLRIAGRKSGQKLFTVSAPRSKAVPPLQAARQILNRLIELYQPLAYDGLSHVISLARLGAPNLVPLMRKLIAEEIADGHLSEVPCAEDGKTYVFRSGGLRLADWLELHSPPEDGVRLLTPFDPVVWDRDRFEHLHGWAYRFEAYTPPPKRKLGYYALPMLYRGRCIGWANLSVANFRLKTEFGYVKSAPRTAHFTDALQAEVKRMKYFLSCI